MRIAFYAPLKPPGHPVPSGDRRLARLFVDALGRAGHEVELAARFQSRDGAGDMVRQARLAAIGRRLADRLVRRYAARAPAARPELWFTYHVYYKAPDFLGPAVADAFAIPYVVAEGSYAPKRASSAWTRGHDSAARALGRADRLIALNRDDLVCLPDLGAARRTTYVPPFLDAAPYAAAMAERARHRQVVADTYGVNPALPWLLTVAMMRAGDKLASYRLLADALGRLGKRPWTLLVAGDGPARGEVESAFRGHRGRVVWLGARPAETLPALYAACDLLVWPAIGEAFGMALLEAAAAGLPAVAADARGVPDIVAAGSTGLLAPPGDATAFATAVALLLDDPDRRRVMGDAASRRVLERHDLDAAARAIDRALPRRAAAA